MNLIFIRFILFTAILLPLFSCSSIDNHPDYRYLDDNLSDRWDLAKKLLGKDVIYIDTSNYGKIARLNNTGLIESENLKIKHNIQSSIEDAFKLALKSGGKIAISGYSSDETHLAIVDAFNSLKEQFSKNVHILYIGDRKFKIDIKQMVENRGAVFLYAKQPETSA